MGRCWVEEEIRTQLTMGLITDCSIENSSSIDWCSPAKICGQNDIYGNCLYCYKDEKCLLCDIFDDENVF